MKICKSDSDGSNIIRWIGSHGPRAVPHPFFARLTGVTRSVAYASVCLLASPALAQTCPAAPPAEVGTDLWSRSNVLGDIGGLRPWLGKYGIDICLQETGEVLGNVTGGIRQGAAYDGLTAMSIGLDTEKAIGLAGGTFNVSALQIYGRNLSAENLASLQIASSIEADRATRLWELWYQQAFPNQRWDVKIGQQSLDQEFIVSQYSTMFVNSVMGWPVLPSADLIAGGPAYPLSTLGLRLQAKPTDGLKMLAGVFDDNPAGSGATPNGTADPQKLSASGTNFRLTDSPLLIAELQYLLNPPPPDGADKANQPAGLPGTYKLGGWYDAGKFADREVDSSGLSLANPASSGMPRLHRGDYGIYALVDEAVWHSESTVPQGVNLFMRAMGAPQEDRNLIDMSLDAGVTLQCPLPRRADDVAGVGFGYAKLSGGAMALDRDRGFFTGTPYPVRSSEEFVEITYQFQAAPWWHLQPDFQYVLNPGGGILSPNNAGRRVGNEAVLGLRTNIIF
jgi:porin